MRKYLLTCTNVCIARFSQILILFQLGLRRNFSAYGRLKSPMRNSPSGSKSPFATSPNAHLGGAADLANSPSNVSFPVNIPKVSLEKLSDMSKIIMKD